MSTLVILLAGVLTYDPGVDYPLPPKGYVLIDVYTLLVATTSDA